MAIDSHEDPLLTALAVMITADLMALDGALLTKTFRHQADLRSLSATLLPGLFIYRGDERWTKRGAAAARCEANITFDYILRAAKIEMRDPAWGALNKVWKQIGSTLLLGESTAVNPAVGFPAGTTLVPEGIALKFQGYADISTETYPMFRGQAAFVEAIQAVPVVAQETVTIIAVRDICGILQDDGTVVPQPEPGP